MSNEISGYMRNSTYRSGTRANFRAPKARPGVDGGHGETHIHHLATPMGCPQTKQTNHKAYHNTHNSRLKLVSYLQHSTANSSLKLVSYLQHSTANPSLKLVSYLQHSTANSSLKLVSYLQHREPRYGAVHDPALPLHTCHGPWSKLLLRPWSWFFTGKPLHGLSKSPVKRMMTIPTNPK